MKRTSSTSERLVAAFFAAQGALRGTMKGSSGIGGFLHFATLRYIAERQKPTMKDVSEFLRVTPPSATALIETLVDEGALRRIADGRDRRIVRLEITPAGRTRIEKGKSVVAARLKKVFTVLSPQEQVTLAAILEKLSRAHAPSKTKSK